MFKGLKRWFGGSGSAHIATGRGITQAGDGHVEHGAWQFDLRGVSEFHDGFPRPAWRRVVDWLETLPDDAQAPCWDGARLAWLCMVRDALGADYRIHASDDALLLTAQSPGLAESTLDYVTASLGRVRRMLAPLAVAELDAREILIVFSDDELYYRYVSYFYPDEGEFAMSSGMHIGGPGHHFMTCDADLRRMEPVIVHELTHSCLRHLPLPAWVNEGMAVNAEQRITGSGDDIYTVQELETKHRVFWNEDTIQEFWAGTSYLRADEGNALSYDLGRILVNGLSADWEGFTRFAARAHADDGGAQAAHDELSLDLGDAVQRFLQRDMGVWSPMPQAWDKTPERGGFRDVRGRLTRPRICG